MRRERNLAIVAQVLERDPVDGFELQLNYCPIIFARDGDYDRIGRVLQAIRQRVGPARAGESGWMPGGSHAGALSTRLLGSGRPVADFSAFVKAARDERVGS